MRLTRLGGGGAGHRLELEELWTGCRSLGEFCLVATGGGMGWQEFMVHLLLLLSDLGTVRGGAGWEDTVIVVGLWQKETAMTG